MSTEAIVVFAWVAGAIFGVVVSYLVRNWRVVKTDRASSDDHNGDTS